MEKRDGIPKPPPLGRPGSHRRRPWLSRTLVVAAIICIAQLYRHGMFAIPPCADPTLIGLKRSPYGAFPQPGDPFRFIPCTNTSLPPSLEDGHPERSWSRLFDPDPAHWSWGKEPNETRASPGNVDDPYAGRG